MSGRRRLLLLTLGAWAALPLTEPARATGAAASIDLDRCAREFAARPEARQSARCFWVAGGAGDRQAAGRAVGELLARHPENPGLQLYLALLQPSARDEWLYRAAAGGFAGRDATGEFLARYDLVQLLLKQGRLDEAAGELERVAAVAPASDAGSRANNVALVHVQRARLLYLSGDLERAGTELDRVPPGPLRDESWLVMANTVHLDSGRTDRAWDECLRLAAPGLSHFYRAKGLYCQARVLLSRSDELPSAADRGRIQQAAREAIHEAAAAGDGSVAARAHSLLLMLAPTEAEAAGELQGCLAVAPADFEKRLCLRALARRLAAVGQIPPPAVQRALGAMALDDPTVRAQEYGDQMRVSWTSRPLDEFLRDGRRALDEIEALRARQAGAEIRMGSFSTWAEEYAWFAGRLLLAAGAGRCPSCLDLAFDTTERLRARGLAESLGTAGPGRQGDSSSPRRLAALGVALRNLAERERDTSLPASERAHAARDRAPLAAEETHLRRLAAAAPSPDPATAPAGQASLATVQRLLRPDEALLSFQIASWTNWSGDFGGGAWLVVATHAGRHFYRLAELGRGALRREVADLLESQREAHRIALTAALYRQLLAPALADLPAAVDRLIVAPDDDLHRLPFAALRETPDSAPLVSRYQIDIIPSATLWTRWRSAAPEPPAARPALVLADPPAPSAAERQTFQTAGIELPAAPLPGARQESRAVLRYLGWGSDRRTGREVSPAALNRPPDRLRRFALVHFAAHSIIDDRNPDRSGIWLGPAPGFAGLLQVPAIVQLRCDGRLVVLSTCSGNGGPLLRGEGVMSLAHAFFQARARTVVASLWPLTDDDAEALLRGFYRHLGEGDAVSAALRLAQIERLQEGPDTPIAAWAGLVALGDGSLIPFPGGRHPWAPLWWLAGGTVALLALLTVALLVLGRRRGPRTS
jgi:CHAT domain-containing protein